MRMTRGVLQGRCTRDAAGNWVADERAAAWADLDRSAATAFPPAVRPRTLLLVLGFSPHYLTQLSPDERACYAAVSRATAAHLGRLGFPTLEAGAAFGPDDFLDLRHLSASGGTKLAEAVAPQVRDLARRLGYVSGGGR
jgi:hypothetical protein